MVVNRNNLIPLETPVIELEAAPLSVRFARLLGPFLIAWTGLLTLWLYWYSVRGAGLAGWDDYDRAAWGAAIWACIRQGDWGLAWLYTNSQTVWPFLHSWITAALFFLFGPSMSTARLIALGAWFGTAALIVRWFYRNEGDNSPVLAFIGAAAAWLLFTTCPTALEHAASVMSELPGLFLVMLAISAMPKRNDAAPLSYLWPGFCLGLLFYFKYNYAVLTCVGLGLARLARSKWSFKSLFDFQNIVLFGAPALLMGAWLIPNLDGKLKGLFYFAVNNPNARTPFSFKSFLFYPVGIPPIYFASVWLFPATLVLIILAVMFSKRIRLTDPVAACFVVHFLAAVIHPMKDIRFVFIPMGLYFVLFGQSIVELTRLRISGGVSASYSRVFALILLVCMLVMGYQTHLHRVPHASLYHVYMAPIRTVIDEISPDDHIAFLIAHDQMTPPSINFHLTCALEQPQNPIRGEPFRWNHYCLLMPGEEARAKSIDERYAYLRHEMYLDKINVVVTLQSTAPWKISRWDELFGGAQEYANLVPYMDEFEMVLERTFYKTDALLRIYRLKSSIKKEGE
ncbi:MAG: hypothetical protein GC154_03595 [bacterium]|nr:hypothetical protein [bacterium]